jgi:predicted ATPase/DNA-binding CsgD family transcriptional regulator
MQFAVAYAPVTNLPADIATFIGRGHELTRACQLLRHVRLLTLTGPGGVGKTRLAMRVAATFQGSTADGVWIADLGDLPRAREISPERLYTHLALCLGIRHHGQAGLDVLLDHLRSRRVLLVLDNCEHLVPAIRVCVTAMLHTAPHLRILATSRQALGADGEYTLVVDPLPLPDAIKLFMSRAAAAGGRIEADPQLVADLCRRLDGLPLAIQLAAARARSLSVQQLLSRLDEHRFRVLADVAADHRHSTMQRVVDWSHELCTEAERLLWARASVFARAADLPALETVCSGDGLVQAAVVDLVSGLVAKSVLTADHTTSPVRYHVLDTLRDYGARKLADAGDTQRVRRRHRDYYHHLVADAANNWLGPTELDAMATVHRDLPDILAAIDESITSRDLPTARAICRNLVRVRSPFFHGFLDLARQQLRRVIDASHANGLANAEDAADVAATMASAAWVATTQGHHETAQTLLGEARALHRQWNIAITAPVLFAEGGSEALGAGSPRAISLLDSARTSFTDPGAAGDQHMATMMWAMATAFAGEPAEAVAAADDYLHHAQQAQAPWATSWALWVAALASLRGGDYDGAIDSVSQALRLQRDMADSWGATWSLELCAWIIAARADHADNPRGEAERAGWLMGASRARQERIGVTLAGLRPLAAAHARAHTRITAILDDIAAAAAIDAGSRGHAQAVRVALGERTPRRPSASTSIGLTDREKEIAILITEGLSSIEIAAQLRVTAGTVNVHVRNILRKLGVRKRAGIAAWVATQPNRLSRRAP